MPSSRPRISFDEHGICNACNYQILKKKLIGVKDKKNLRRFVINIDQQTEIMIVLFLGVVEKTQAR